MKNSAPSAGPEERAHAADHHHREQLAGERHAEIGSAEVMRLLNSSSDAGEPGERRPTARTRAACSDRSRSRRSARAVSFSRIATSTVPTGERWKRQQRSRPPRTRSSRPARSSWRAPSKLSAELGRPGDAAEAVLAAGHRGPAEGDRRRASPTAPASAARNRRRAAAGSARRTAAASSDDEQPARAGPAGRSCRETSCAGSGRRHRRRGRTRRHGRTTPGRCGRPGCSAPCRRCAKITTSVADVTVRPIAAQQRAAAGRRAPTRGDHAAVA